MTAVAIRDVLERVEQGRPHEDDIYVLAGVVRMLGGTAPNVLDLDNAEWETDEGDDNGD